MELLILFLAIYGLAFALKETDGPWGLIGMARGKLFANKHVGTFFYKLLECYFCLGFHCGWLVYLLSDQPFHLQFIILWGLAGGVISLTLNKLLTWPTPGA